MKIKMKNWEIKMLIYAWESIIIFLVYIVRSIIILKIHENCVSI